MNFPSITIDFIIDHIYVTFISDIKDFMFKGISMFWARPKPLGEG